MALSGSAYNAFARHRLVIEWSASQSIPNNNSTVTARVYLQSMDGYGAMYAPVMNNGSVTVNGQTQTFTANSDLSAYQKKLLTTKYFTVPHNADGSKSFSFSATYNINVTFAGVFYGNRTASGSATLNTIPRASGVSLSNANINLGTATTINISRASGSFTHTLVYRIGGYSVTIANKTSSTSVSYTPIIDIANQFTNETSGWGTITCDTYNGNTKIGTSSVRLTVKTTDTDTFRPVINSVILSETVPEITSKFGAMYIQEKSRIRAVTSCSQKYGAGVKSITTTVGNITMTGANVVSGAINQSGTLVAKTVVIDSRGYSASFSQNVKIEPYSNPKISLFDVARRPTAQEILDMNWKATTTSVGTKNVMGYRLKWKLSTSTSWTTLASESNATKQDWSNNKVQAGADVGKTYDVLLEVFDSLMTVTSQYQIATATVPMSWGKNGTAIGKVYEEDGATFQVRGSGFYEGLLTTAPNIFAYNGGSLNLNNSDMVGLNGIYFGATHGNTDPADNDGEGLLFPHKNTIIPADGNINRNDGWDTFRVVNGEGFLNSKLIFIEDSSTPLWEGAIYMQAGQTVNPSRHLEGCPNGWILQWSEYANGQAQNYNYNYTVVHKGQYKTANGAGVYHTLSNTQSSSCGKYIYISNTSMSGHANNNVGTSGKFVLRRVYAF